MTTKVTLMASAETAPKAKHRISLTRAALYLLEGCLQNPGPQTTYPKILQWNKVWDKIRKANNRMLTVPWEPEGQDIEKQMLRRDGETDVEFIRRDIELKAAAKRWEDEIVTLSMNDRMRDTCRETVEWIHAHRDDAKVQQKLSGPHAASLLIGFGLCKEEPDSDYEIEEVDADDSEAAA